ncbi:ankyrin repeat-containing domain protein [Aspergillus stella-maris]|uniref:ankyrin repeat-containing domain protein n=1 Tax=Aspergillus stella-maris TaxID=1810926 RepID=UPI003CCD8E95
MDESVWDTYKPELYRLYIRDDKTLVQVMEYMSNMYSFDETKSHYLKHFARWGFQKNEKISLSNGVFIGRRIQKRKQMFDKESEVHIKGVEYSPPKVRKLLYNKAYVSTIDGLSLSGAPSPATPEGIVVCTPATPGMRLQWDLSLPWLRFSKLFRPEQDEGPPSPASALAINSPRPADALSLAMNLTVLDQLRFVVPWNRLCHPPNVNSTSRTATLLSILMPAESGEQLAALSSRLAQSKQSIADTMRLEMFLLSNNLVSHGPMGKTFESMSSHDRRVLEILRASPWNSVSRIKMLLSAQEPTAGAIAENLFASALRQLEVNTVQMMLEAGMSPDGCIDTVDQGPLTPLQFSAYQFQPEYESDVKIDILRLLTSYGADLDKCYNDKSALQYATESRYEKAITFLLAHGAHVTPSCLSIAARYIRDPVVFQRFLGPDTDVNVRSGWQGFSPLTNAVRCGNMEVMNVLLSRGANVNALVDIDFDEDIGVTTVLGSAVLTARLEIIEALLQGCPVVSPETDGLPYVSPLALAINRAKINSEVVELLLKKGFDVNMADCCGKWTLLERALKAKNATIIDRPFSHNGQPSSPLVCAIETGALDIAKLLIKMGARLNDEYKSPPGTVLGAAIQLGDLAFLNMVWAAGATSISPSLAKIGNLETVVWLEERGILEGILDASGPQILGAAMLAMENSLVEKLLYEFDLDHATTNTSKRNVYQTQATPLQAAIESKRLDFIFALLDRGAKVADYDLAAAVEFGNTELIHQLLMSVHGSVPTAITEALKRPDVLDLFLAAKVDPRGRPEQFLDFWYLEKDSPDFLNPPESILEVVCKRGDEQILKTFLNMCSWDPRLVGRALTVSILFNHTGIAHYLLGSGADISQDIVIEHKGTKDEGELLVYKEVVTPLQLAVKDQRTSLVKLLLDHPSIDVNYLGPDARRRTALQHAVNNGNMELINLLLSHGADINAGPARDGGATALQIAAIQGFLGIAQRLIELNADVNAAAARIDGRTALEGAAEHGRIDMLHMLLDAGAAVTGDRGQQQYRRAIELAEKNGHHAAASLLMAFEPQHR